MKKIVLLLVLVFIMSCTNEDNAAFEPTELTFTEIGKGGLPGDGAENIPQANYVINTQTDWQNLMDQMNSYNSYETTSFTETTIDFDNFTVIAIFLEVKPNVCEVTINTIVENETNITVTASELNYQLSAITQPYHIVKIPNTEKEVVFE